MVTAEQLVKFHEGVCNNARLLVTPKGKDYSANADQDTLANLRLPYKLKHAENNLQTMKIILDLKWGRIDSLTSDLSKPVNFESLEQNVHDFINYLIYMLWFYNEIKVTNVEKQRIQAIESGKIIFEKSGKEIDL